MRKMKIKFLNKENIFVLAIIFVAFFGFLYCTGTLLSGYHLVDDHEFYSIRNSLKNAGFWTTLGRRLAGDLTIRFRPLYSVERVVGVALFGAGTFRWSCVKAFEIVIASWLLYYFARNKGESIVKAALFTALCVWGPQTAVWWRLGPQESVGILLFAICLNVTWMVALNGTGVKRCIYVIVLVLLSLQKESFLVCVPAFFVLLFAFEEKPESKFVPNIIAFFKRHCVEITIVMISLIIEVSVIIWRVGFNSVGYAGFSSQDSWIYYIGRMGQTLITGGKNPTVLVLLTFVLIYCLGINKKNISSQIMWEVMFCLFIWGIQLLVYAKSEMFERYFIPWIVVVAYFVVLCAPKLLTHNVKAVQCIMGGCILLCLFNAKDVFSSARGFTKKGKDLSVCVEEFVKRTDDTAIQVYGVSNDPEIDTSFGVYLKYKYGYDHYGRIGQDDGEGAKAYFGMGVTVEQYFADNNISDDNYDWIITPSYQIAILKEAIQK